MPLGSLRTRLPVAFLLLLTATANLAGQSRADEQLTLALGLIERGLHDDAARHLSTFVERYPRHVRAADAWYRLGTCQQELNKRDLAIRSFKSALTLPKFALRPECRYRLAQELKHKKSFAAAAAQFAALLDEAGNTHYLAPAALYGRGESLRDAGNSTEAMQCFRSVPAVEAALAKATPGQFGMPALYQAGFLMLREKRFDTAEKLFGQAADRYPKHSAAGECRFLQGEAAYRGGNLDRANKALERAASVGGEHADDAMLSLGLVARDQKDLERALNWFRVCAKRFPTSELVAKACLEQARLLRQHKRWKPAIDACTAAMQHASCSDNQRRGALELRALSLWDDQRRKPALTDLAAAIALAKGTDLARLHYHCGQIHAEAKEWQLAAQHYGKAAAIPECNQDLRGDSLYGSCLALHRLGEFAAANQVAAEFQKTCGEHALASTVAFAIAENHFALRDYKTALPRYRRVPKNHQLRRKADFKSAWCEYLIGEKSAAAGSFRKLQAGNDSIAEEALAMTAMALFHDNQLPAALAACDSYKERHPKGRLLARNERIAARILKSQGKLVAAADRLAAAARASGGGANDVLERADLLFEQGEFAEASKSYLELRNDKNQTAARALLGLAWCSFELNNDNDCAGWVDAGLAHPKSSKKTRGELIELRIALHHRRKEWSKATATAQEFLQDYAELSQADDIRYSLGVSLSRANELPAAAQALRQALRGKKLTEPGRAWYELAWVQRRSKQEDQALSSFRKVTSTTKDKDLVGEAWLHLGEAELAGKDKDVTQALAYLGKVSGQHRPRAIYRIGFCQLESEPERALLAFEELRKLGDKHPLFAEASFLAGECLRRTRRNDAAASRYQDVLTKPEHERAQAARLHLADCQLQGNAANQAAPLLEEFLRRCKPEDKLQAARGQLLLGKARQQLRQWKRAQAAFRATTDLCETELAAEAQFRLGQCRRQAGNLQSAADAFVALSVLYGHEEWVCRGLLAAGDSYRDLRKPNKARKFYQELQRRYPKSRQAQTAKDRLQKLGRKV